MRVAHVNVDEAMLEATRAVQEQKEVLIVNYCDRTWCACGKRASIREDVCAELGIPILKAHFLAGANVVFPGDLSLMEVKAGHSRFGEKTIKRVHDYLRSKGLPVAINGNDLILSDLENRTAYKVGSHGSNFVGDVTESVVHISINMDLDLVKRICLKPMVKIPGELGSRGVTAEELWQVIRAGLDREDKGQ